jgi:pheophorbide a oxygenase
LDPDRPTPLEFLGQRYVTYRDNNHNWVVLDDVCPHRLAPLSEGRVDRATNTIECSYHGWAFDGQTGACDRIPQAEAAIEATAKKSSRSSAQSYSVVVEKNVLWTWPWAEDCLSVMSIPEAHPVYMVAGVGVNSTTYTRDLPYGWDTLLENLVDPSHVPFVRIPILYLVSVSVSVLCVFVPELPVPVFMWIGVLYAQ